jgi:hypothetical protein
MPVKSNVCAPAATLAYAIASEGGRGRLVWEDRPVDGVDVNQVLAPQRPEDAEARRDAEAFLRDYLKDGPRLQRDVEQAAKAERIAERTLKRAKKAVGVESDKVGFQAGAWYWRLPDPASANAGAPKGATPIESAPKGAIYPDVAPFEERPVNTCKYARFFAVRLEEGYVAGCGPLRGWATLFRGCSGTGEGAHVRNANSR